MGSVVLDASIVLAMLNTRDALHKPAQSAVYGYWAQNREFTVPVSVLGEALVLASRSGADAVDEVESFVDALASDVPVIDRRIVREAASVRAAKPSLKLPDALVIATGRVVDASIILTGDKKWCDVDMRVEVVTT
jgi:predicted nucleic acid-binding protein